MLLAQNCIYGQSEAASAYTAIEVADYNCRTLSLFFFSQSVKWEE